MPIPIPYLATDASDGRCTNMVDWFPSTVNTAAWRLVLQPAYGHPQGRFQYMQWNFLLSGDVPLTMTGNAFRTAMFTVTSHQIALVMPWEFYLADLHSVYNSPTRLIIPAWTKHSGNPAVAQPRVCALGASIFFTTATHGKCYTGRAHWPMLQDGDYDGSHLTPAFTSRMSAFLGWLTSPISYAGITLQMAIWSRKLNIFTPVTGWHICPRVTNMNRRRVRNAGCKTFVPVNQTLTGLLPPY